MTRKACWIGPFGWTSLIVAAIGQAASAQLYINEILFNPGGQAIDTREEYVELRGTPNMSLENHYLIFLENELDSLGTGDAGKIEGIFDLGGHSMGSNGFLTFRQKNNRYAFGVAPGTTDLVNMGSGQGFGNGESSSVGYSDDHTVSDPNSGTLSNSGATAMLIHNHGGLVPTVGFNMDQGNDGLDSRPDSLQQPIDDWPSKWTILDSVGYFAEPPHSEFGRLYGAVNFISYSPLFGPAWEPNVEPGAEYELVEHEIEHLARWGNSTGQTVADWHTTNLTDNFGSGYINNTFLLRQSCLDFPGCHPANDNDPTTPAPEPPGGVESNKNVPYGTILTGDLGAPNFLIGDYSKDGMVDAADYTSWRDTVGQTGSEYVVGESPLIHNHPPADGNHDFLVDQQDYAIWRAQFGQPFSSPPGAGGFGLSGGESASNVPEPAGWMLALLATLVPMRRVKARI